MDCEHRLHIGPSCRGKERATTTAGADCDCPGDDAFTAQRASVDIHAARAGARSTFVTDLEHAASDSRVAGVKIVSSEGECAAAAFGNSAGILDHAGKGRALVVAPDGERIRPEQDRTFASQRANRYAGGSVSADVQLTIAVECNAGLAAFGFILKGNHPAVGAGHSDISGDVCICGGGAVDES